jgi:3-hydroxybutyrate dehydrogenase
MELKGKSAVVTGSTSGIGLAIARSLAHAGADVVLNGLGDVAANEATARALAEEAGVRVLYSPADMSKPAEITGLIRMAIDAFGGVDILVPNAGIQHVAPIDEFPDEKWELVVRIDLISQFYLIKAALPGMKARGWGRIVSISSAHSLVASPFKSAYIAAKHGVAGLIKCVAMEVATEGVTANAVAPGYVWTPLVEKQIPEQAKARGISEEAVKIDVLLAAQPTKQFVTVEQIAATVRFLCSDAAAQITGTTISVDGGWTAH